MAKVQSISSMKRHLGAGGANSAIAADLWHDLVIVVPGNMTGMQWLECSQFFVALLQCSALLLCGTSSQSRDGRLRS